MNFVESNNFDILLKIQNFSTEFDVNAKFLDKNDENFLEDFFFKFEI